MDGRQEDESPARASASSFETAAADAAQIRVPRHVRVLLSDNETVEYVPMELYVRRSLPREWIASWANYSGGHHSLRSGAVAIRTYAIGFVNNPRGTHHDICATTTCQVYGSATNSHTDAAVSATSHFVMANANSAITLRMTEYSAENNSLGLECGDGYTSPSCGCLADPVCTGEERFGHGRGLCQWGSARWATGRNFSGRNMIDTSTHDFPLKTWSEILEQYYPHLELMQGAPLIVGDAVRLAGTSNRPVRLCSGGGIENGVNCPQIASKFPGSTGTIVDGPVLVTSDGRGHTWWKIRWNDGNETTGWTAENWIERDAVEPPVLEPIPDQIVDEGEVLTLTASAHAPEKEWPLTGFEEYSASATNGTVLFRQPRFSGSTDSLLDGSPNISAVTDSFPAGNESGRALHAAWSWNTSANPWLRLTTSGTANLPNPVIDFTRAFRFRVYADRAVKVALGLRETNNEAGTTIGADGGSNGAIKFVGAPDTNGDAPNPVRTVDAGAWTTLVFDLPNEPVIAFTGDGELTAASGLGVFEHLAFVPADGTGEYHVYLDDFAVIEQRVLTFSLDPGAPAGAEIDAASGIFTWTPTEAQGPGVYPITIRVTDDGSSAQSATATFEVTVNEVNHPPVLDPIPDRTIHAGATLVFEASASDPDLPPNSLVFSLESQEHEEATIDSGSGVFSWTTTTAEAGSDFSFTVRVTDDGSASLSDSETFTASVAEPLAVQEIASEESGVTLTWSAIEGATYRVQYKMELTDPEWVDVEPEFVADGSTASFTVEPEADRQFFRILLVE